jgi:hypothetical protein
MGHGGMTSFCLPRASVIPGSILDSLHNLLDSLRCALSLIYRIRSTMGPAQRTEPTPALPDTTTTSSQLASQETLPVRKDRSSDKKKLSGMALVSHKCLRRKNTSDKCAASWYDQQFFAGQSMDQEEACRDKYNAYRTCILKGIKKEIYDKHGLPTPQEGIF